MRDRKVGYYIAGAVFLVTVIVLLANNSPTAGQDMSPVDSPANVSGTLTRVSLLPYFRLDPTLTPTPTPTNTPTPSPTPSPSPIPRSNLLPNPSFEEGWYDISTGQVPNRWTLQYDEGENPLTSWPWLKPESRVLPKNQLPPEEHDLFVWDGFYTVKIFKGYGAISFRMITSKALDPGRYELEISVFPDLYYSCCPKQWATNPEDGELRITIAGQDGNWISPAAGKKSTIRHTFDVNQAGNVEIKVAFRGRWPILNNGWFMDDWHLDRIAADAAPESTAPAQEALDIPVSTPTVSGQERLVVPVSTPTPAVTGEP